MFPVGTSASLSENVTPGGSLIQARPGHPPGSDWAWKEGLQSTVGLGSHQRLGTVLRILGQYPYWLWWEECKYPEDTQAQLLDGGLDIKLERER